MRTCRQNCILQICCRLQHVVTIEKNRYQAEHRFLRFNIFKGWPKLNWILTDPRHLSKPPSNWHPTTIDSGGRLAYVEYKIAKDGSVLGVAHKRSAIYKHCRYSLRVVVQISI